MPSDDVTDALRSRLDTARGDYNKNVLAKHNDQTQSQSFAVDWSADRVVVQSLDGTRTTKNVITNGAIGLGDPVTVRGNTADERPRVKRSVAVKEVATGGKIKYLYSIVNTSGLRELYVGGWQKQSKLVATFPNIGTVFPVTTLDAPILDNLGSSGWQVNLRRFTFIGQTRHPDVPGFNYTYQLYNFERLTSSGQTVWQSGSLVPLFDNENPVLCGYDFAQRGFFRIYSDGIDWGAYTDSPEGGLNLNLYSLALYQDTRLTGSASIGIPIVNYPFDTGSYDYFALPRNGNPLIVSNSNIPALVAGEAQGRSLYGVNRINKTGFKGIGYWNGPGQSFITTNFKPVWYDDNGATIVTGSTFDAYSKIFSAANFFDLDDSADQFYTFVKADLDITKNQKIAVEVYDKTFTKTGEKRIPTFKASKLGSNLIIHSASYHP